MKKDDRVLVNIGIKNGEKVTVEAICTEPEDEQGFVSLMLGFLGEVKILSEYVEIDTSEITETLEGCTEDTRKDTDILFEMLLSK